MLNNNRPERRQEMRKINNRWEKKKINNKWYVKPNHYNYIKCKCSN